MKRQAAKTRFSVVLFVLLGISIFLYLNFKTIVVTGDSMLPSFKNGERVLVTKAYWLVGDIQRKDVVVINDPTKQGGHLIKRVLALGGDLVDFYNGPLDRPITEGQYRVPEGHIYVIGDNKRMSEDSRRFGPVPKEEVIGKVVHLGSENSGAFATVAIASLSGLLVLWYITGRIGPH